jgi:fumarate hydratase class II
MRAFCERCVVGIRPNREKMRDNLHRSLMLATALNPYIGYENAAKTVHLAHEKGMTLREACITLGFLDGEAFDRVFHPEDMIGKE